MNNKLTAILAISIISIVILITLIVAPFRSINNLILSDFRSTEKVAGSKIAENYFDQNPKSKIVMSNHNIIQPVYSFVFYYSNSANSDYGIYDIRVYELKRKSLTSFEIISRTRYQISDTDFDGVIKIIKNKNLNNGYDDKKIVKLTVTDTPYHSSNNSDEAKVNPNDISTFAPDSYMNVRMANLPPADADLVLARLENCRDNEKEQYYQCLPEAKKWTEQTYPIEQYLVKYIPQ